MKSLKPLDKGRLQASRIKIGSYGFCTPVTHTQVLIEINFQAPKTL